MLFGAFIVPILAILIFNSVIFVLVIRVLVKHTSSKLGNKTDKKTIENAKRLLVAVFGIMFLFGLSWGFGALTISDASVAFQFLFAISTSLQGFFIFVFFCVLGKEVRGLWLQFLCRGRKIRWFTSSSADTQNKSAPTSSTAATSSTQYQSVLQRSVFLRRPDIASEQSVSDSSSSFEMEQGGPTIANLHSIQEEPEEAEEDQPVTQTSVRSHSSGHDKVITHEQISDDSDQPSSRCELGQEGLSQTESATDYVNSPQPQNTPSSLTSDADSVIIENPCVEDFSH